MVGTSSGPSASVERVDSRARTLQVLGILCGLAAGAWLGAAEAPTKLVSLGMSPIVISLTMVSGVFLARWSLPALVSGTASVISDIRRAPHLVVWAVLAGCLWAVANTLTIFAIRDIGLSIAFPLWNSNSLLGILWGFLFFNELRDAGPRRWMGVLGGALIMCVGAALLALASPSPSHGVHSFRGVWAALGAGVLWGTMYIPYRKAYLTGMNPLSFVTVFTFGELGTMLALAAGYVGVSPLRYQLASARGVIFWLMLGGFIWVVGDLFQQFAAKYIGISRGVPLSNSNQLWGLLWGVFVFGELQNRGAWTYAQVVGGSLLMLAGAGAVALSSATGSEQLRWREAAGREIARYGTSAEYVEARMDGREVPGEVRPARNPLDWIVIALATGVFIYFATLARLPEIHVRMLPAALLTIATLALFAYCGVVLYRTTRFR
ncbi:MAG TPA: GRP family sugar transporter [Candidatus Acidoferrum sp.]